MKKSALFLIFLVGVFFLIHLMLRPSPPQIRNAQPIGSSLICFGDSLTYGTGATQGNDYPSILSGLLAQPVINAGVPGDTTASALRRLQEDVLDLDPRIVFITLGGNDLKNGVAKETAFKNLETIVRQIQDQGALVVLGGIDFPVRGRGYGQAYIDFARENRVVLIPNIFEGLMGRKSLMSDPIHPNDAGYEVLAQKFYQAVAPYL